VISLTQIPELKGENVEVHILGDFRPPGFSPSLITIHVNDTVAFINDASLAVTYSIGAKD